MQGSSLATAKTTAMQEESTAVRENDDLWTLDPGKAERPWINVIVQSERNLKAEE